MKLEKQVASLELSQKLVELGVTVDSHFAWNKINGQWIPFELMSNYHKANIPAYTVAELGQMLPIEVSTRRVGSGFICESDVCFYGRYEREKTEADARAAMLIWLIENKHITVEEINAAAK